MQLGELGEHRQRLRTLAGEHESQRRVGMESWSHWPIRWGSARIIRANGPHRLYRCVSSDHAAPRISDDRSHLDYLAFVSIAATYSILEQAMIRKLTSGEFRLYSRKKDPRTGKRRNLGTFKTRAAAEKHEREVQYFKRNG
jgi:hypothetical protein